MVQGFRVHLVIDRVVKCEVLTTKEREWSRETSLFIVEYI